MTALFPLSETLRTRWHGFVASQFGTSPTTRQKVFDFAFGVVLPVPFILANPVLFRGGEISFLPGLQLFAYSATGLSMIILTLWLCFGETLENKSCGVGGILVFYGLLPLILGCVCFGASVVFGVVAVFSERGSAMVDPTFWKIRVVGLVCCFGYLSCAFVYVRNGLRARRAGGGHAKNSWLWFFLVPLLLFSGPVVLQVYVSSTVSRCIVDVTHGTDAAVVTSSLRLRRLRWSGATSFDPIVRAWAGTKDPELKARLAAVYERGVGKNIGIRWDHLCP